MTTDPGDLVLIQPVGLGQLRMLPSHGVVDGLRRILRVWRWPGADSSYDREVSILLS